MDKQDWITQWIARNRETSIDSDLVDSVMTTVTARPRKSDLTISWLAPLAQRIQFFRSRTALLTTGAVGGFLRVAVFLYVLLFVS